MPAPDHVPYRIDSLPDAEASTRAHAYAAKLQQRRTCRDFSAEPVPRAVIEAAIIAAGSAPSGANHQPWHFAVVASPEKKARDSCRGRGRGTPILRGRCRKSEGVRRMAGGVGRARHRRG